MALKPALQLKIGQQLSMTPQLQQAIRLLQLSTLELGTEIQELLDSNPMLEQSENESLPDTADEQNDSRDSEAGNEGIEKLPGEEDGWDQYYESLPSANPLKKSTHDLPEQLDIPDISSESLHDHLYWQLNLTPFSERDLLIAETLIDSINDDGYLGEELTVLHESLSRNPGLHDLELHEVEATLHRIQHFDPVGVGARNLAECLLAQLEEYVCDDALKEKARLLISHHLDVLGNQDRNSLKRKLSVDDETLEKLIELVRSLEPRPGNQLPSGNTEYITPDVYVRKREGRWEVSLNASMMPKIEINNFYAGLINQARKEDASYMKNQLQEARWFLKSLETRNDTILRVAQCIVENQQDFFEHGPEAMKPLILKDVAEAVDLHESTISRVTNRKYLHSPKGIFEFKYFFSSHVSTADGGECSAIAIQAMIKKLVAEEPAKKPLSDSKIAQLLNDKGIQVARRTVAKYREALGITSSSDRKRLL